MNSKKLGNVFLILILVGQALFLLSRPIQADSYADLLTEQQEITAKINQNRSEIEDLNEEMVALDATIQENQTSVDNIARTVQTTNQTNELVNIVLSSQSFSELIQQVVAINLVTQAANDQLIKLKESKEEKAKLLDSLNAAQLELDQKNQQLAESIAAGIPDAVFTPETPEAQWLGISEEQARANIVARESGGNYEARNGRYYGAYQLDISYLNGDLSPANQDATAEAYVAGRYGSWANAWAFWQANHWY